MDVMAVTAVMDVITVIYVITVMYSVLLGSNLVCKLYIIHYYYF